MHLSLIAGVAMLAAVISAASTNAQQPAQAPENDPLFMRLAASPAPDQAAILDGGGTKHSAYELYVANLGQTPMKIVGLTVTQKKSGTDVGSESGSGKQLAAMYLTAREPGAAEPNELILKPWESGVFFVWVDFAPGAALPDTLDTSIRIEQHGEHAASGTVRARSLTLNPAAPIVIQSPLRGKNWSAANGPSNTSAHRRAVLLVNGQPLIGQRYAIDWVQLGDDGKTFAGDEHRNSSYHAWDQEIHAVADGRVVETRDGIAENVPNSDKLATVINWDTLAGNHIIQDLGCGRFAAYAHLRPGTLKVKNGDTVKAGDVIARLGNTGNSSEPHLHFQICDAPSFPKSQGLPFAIESYTLQDFKLDKDAAGKETLVVKSTRPIQRQEPMENELDSF
jgi:hypothetical protein